jgi:Xaa-Pro aminopeptidase
MSTARADGIAERLAERELDGLLISDLVNVRWATGFTGSNGMAVVGRDGLRRFYTDFRYLTQSAEEVDDAWERLIHRDLLEKVAETLPAEWCLGVDDATMSVREHRRLSELTGEAVQLADAGGIVEDLRAIKDPDELDRIRAASRLADEALEAVLSRGVVGRTERDVALDLEFAMRRRGAEGPSFPPIVAAGAHGALPHAEPRDVEIPAGTLVVVDWGAQIDGYCSDCTRTFATGDLEGQASEIYELVERAQADALAAVAPGASCKEIDAVARTLISDAGHGEHFGHGLGHGVGLEVHEEPRLTASADGDLVSGNVVTVEPGVYLPGELGVRIEDLVVVSDDGGREILSGLPKSLTRV